MEYVPLNSIKPVEWRGIRLVDKLFIGALPLLALLILAFRYLDEAYLRRLARTLGAQSMIIWLANGINAWLVAGGLLLLAVGYLLWWRHRLMNDKRLWYSTGCPYCQERELVRVKRKTSDRRYTFFAIPAYRFACRNCSWRGLRIGRQEISPERERELEEALIRFQPNGSSGILLNRAGGDSKSRNVASETTTDANSHLSSDEYTRWMEEYVPIRRDDAGQTLAEPPEYHPDAEQPDELEWLWRRPSDV
jgi:hypothetical protein